MDKIRIALLGSVSVGKSTLVNTLFVRQFSKTKIKRTTMVPYIFKECKNTISETEIVNMEQKINEYNIELIKMTEDPNFSLTIDGCVPISFDVPKIFDLLTSKNAANIELEIYDIPGLNDNRTQNVYFEWVEKNFYLFDIIIFITSIDKALNETDELNILKFIMKNIKHHKEKYSREIAFIPIVNKCDNMYCENGELNFSNSDEEYNSLFSQITNTIETQAKIYNINASTLTPISSEDAFIYRTFYVEDIKNFNNIDNKYYHKLGINEYGKTKWNIYSKNEFDKYKLLLIKNMHNKENFLDNIKNTGYYKFRNTLNFVIEENIYKFLTERINYTIIDRMQFDKDTIQKYLDEMISYHEKEQRINNMYEKTSNNVLIAIEKDILEYLYAFIKLDFDTYPDPREHLDNNLNRFNQYITFVNNIRDIFKRENILSLRDQLYQYIINIAKKIVELYIQYVHTKSSDYQNIASVIGVLILLKDDLGKSFNLNISENLTLEKLDMMPLLKNTISLILDNFSKALQSNIEIDYLLFFLQFISEEELYENKMTMRKVILHILVNKLVNFTNTIDTLVYKKNILYLTASKKLLQEYLDLESILPFYYLIDNSLKNQLNKMQYASQMHSFVIDWHENIGEKYNLDLEKLYISLCD